MAQKSKSEDAALLLLALGLFLTGGKGLIPAIGPPGATGAAGAPGAPGSNGENGKSGSPGENSSPPDATGATSKGQAPPDNTSTGAAPPDKSKTNSNPGDSGFMGSLMGFLGNIANYINPLAPPSTDKLPNGSFFVPGLDVLGNSTGGPGPGASTPSITTVYGDKTYTNFNPALLTNTPTDKTNPTTPMDVIIQMPNTPTMPQVIYSDPTQKQTGPIIPVDKGYPTSYTIPLMAATPTARSQTPSPMMNLPPGNPSVPNPLPPMPAFGQDFLNSLIGAGQGLSGIFNNLKGFALPVIPGVPVVPSINVAV